MDVDAPAYSNFLFVDQNYYSDAVVRRILSIARKLGFRSLLVEHLDKTTCAHWQIDDAALAKRSPDFLNSKVHRLLFLRSPVEQQPGPEDFIGYAIIRQDFYRGNSIPKQYVFEAVMPSHRRPITTYIHCARSYEVLTPFGKRSVTGVIYAQQNAMTMVCAHVGLRSVLSCVLPSGDITYEEMNAAIGIDHSKIKVGEGNGLSPAQIETVLNSLGVSYTKIVHEPSAGIDLPTEFQRDIYGFIESGSPALVGFELTNSYDRHIIPVLGHTFNEDAWVPEAQRTYFGRSLKYYPSENWLSGYIVHDDNFGPYYCLPRHFLKKDNFRIIYGLNRVGTKFTAVDAEAIACEYFSAIAKANPTLGIKWYDRFSIFAQQGQLVLRTQLVSKEQYVAHLTAIRSRDGMTVPGEVIKRIDTALPGTVWLIEASAPELFSCTRRKFGEIALFTDKHLVTPLDTSFLACARLPSFAVTQEAGAVRFDHHNFDAHSELFQRASAGTECG